MSKLAKRSIILVLMVVMVATACIMFVGCKVESDDRIDNTPLSINMKNELYVGNSAATYDLGKVWPGKSVTMVGTSQIFTIADNTITFTGSMQVGKFGVIGSVKVSVDGSEKTIVVIDGVNVSTEDQFRKCLEDRKNVVLQNDITFEQTNGMVYAASVYGNGYSLKVEKVIGLKKNGHGGANLFTIYNNDLPADKRVIDPVTMNGVRIVGHEFPADATEGLVTMEGYGSFFNMSGGKTAATRPNVTTYNCIFENAHKMFFFKNADLTTEGCVYRNASDNVLCMETNGTTGAVLNTKNIVIVNSLDAAILFCGWTATNSPDDFCELNIEGFLDIFNWKSTTTAKLMPNTEQFANLVNSMVQSEIKKKSYQKFLYADSSGNKFMHSGIIAIATGSLKKNMPKINGTKLDQNDLDEESGIWEENDITKLSELKFQMRGFPIPKFAKAIAKTCFIVGYGNTEDAKDIPITPHTKFSDWAPKLITGENGGELLTGRA